MSDELHEILEAGTIELLVRLNESLDRLTLEVKRLNDVLPANSPSADLPAAIFPSYVRDTTEYLQRILLEQATSLDALHQKIAAKGIFDWDDEFSALIRVAKSAVRVTAQ